MYQPGAGEQLHERSGLGGSGKEGRRCTGIDHIAQRVEFFERYCPFSGENIGCEFSPMCGSVQIVIGRENAEVVEIICCSAIVTVCILELSKVVKRGDLF